MNQLIELHDSEIAVIWFDSECAIVIFSSAYVHKSEGEPGRDPRTGWSQRAELVITAATEITLPRAWPCTIFDGTLELDARILDNEIPIPLAPDGVVRLKLEIMDGDQKYTTLELA